MHGHIGEKKGLTYNSNIPKRQWLVKEFNLFKGELEFTERELKKDPRNNSVWNHRFYVIENTTNLSTEDRIKEISWTFQFISKSPNNESAWNYARG